MHNDKSNLQRGIREETLQSNGKETNQSKHVDVFFVLVRLRTHIQQKYTDRHSTGVP